MAITGCCLHNTTKCLRRRKKDTKKPSQSRWRCSLAIYCFSVWKNEGREKNHWHGRILSLCVWGQEKENDPAMMRSVLLYWSGGGGGQTDPFFTPTKNKCETRTFRNAFDYNSNSNEIPISKQKYLVLDFVLFAFLTAQNAVLRCCELLKRDGGTISWNTLGNTHRGRRIIKHTGSKLYAARVVKSLKLSCTSPSESPLPLQHF